MTTVRQLVDSLLALDQDLPVFVCDCRSGVTDAAGTAYENQVDGSEDAGDIINEAHGTKYCCITTG